MPQACWLANQRGEYWIDVALGGLRLLVLIDTGLIDSRGQIGFSVGPARYEQIKLAGGFQSHQTHMRLTADGQVSQTESGSLVGKQRGRSAASPLFFPPFYFPR
jgi:hypothetical protein